MNIIDERLVLALCFCLFIYFIYRPIKKAIISFLDSKIAEIKAELVKAEQIKKDAKHLLKQTKIERDKFEQYKQEILKQTEQKTKDFTNNKLIEMQLILDNSKSSALKSIENKSKQATQKMRMEFVESALNIVRIYLKETNNNSVSDYEILKHIKKD